MNVLDLYASLSLNTENYNNSLSEAKNAADSFGDDIVDALETGAKAYTNLIADSVRAYSNYEETADGIRRIFGETSDGIIANSKNAYKTAQMSSSEYLANAQVLSGALIRTLGDDTEAVTALVDMAMTDLSDNVNAMGTDMNYVMHAYAGFARQEFRMLDNLYLGYGGTKTEARKLLYAMAEEKELLDELGIEFSELPEIEDFDKDKDFSMLTLDNIIKAIHVRQYQMHIAGTTLEEGSTHIQGTIRQTRAAWKDLLKTFAGEEDMSIDEAISHLYDSIFGVNEGEGLLNVIVPRIAQAMEGISDFIVKASPILAETIPQVIDTLKPSLEKAVDSVGTLITDILPSVVDLLWPVVSDVMSTLLDLVTAKMHDTGGIFGLIADVIDFIRENSESIPGLIAAIWGSITALEISKEIMEFITLLGSIMNKATLIVGAIGAIAAILFLYRGEIAQFFHQLDNYFSILDLQMQNIQDIMANIDFAAIGERLGVELLIGIAEGINAGIGMIQDAINNIIGEINTSLGGVFNFFGIDNIGEITLPQIDTKGLKERRGEDDRFLNDRALNAQGHGTEVRKRIDERNKEMDALQKELDEGSWWDVGDDRSMGQRFTDTVGWVTNLLGFNTDLFKDTGNLFNLPSPEPIPDDVTESYENFGETVKTVTNAVVGDEDSDVAGLNSGLDSTAEKMNNIVTASEPAAAALSEGIPEAASALIEAVSGESGEGLNLALDGVNTALANINTNSTNIVNTWNGSLATAISNLEKNSNRAATAFNTIGTAAGGAAGEVGALAGAIQSVIDSINKLNGMKIDIPSIGGGGNPTGGLNIPGRASGGPVDEGDLYWVGEEGPELYVPSRSGTIINNDSLSKLGQTVNVYVSFDGDVIGDADSISGYVTKACNNAIKEAVYAGA